MYATGLIGSSADSIFLIESIFDCLAKLDGKSRLILDRAGKLVASSGCAGPVFDNSHFLKLERGRIVAARSSDEDRLRELLETVGTAVETMVLHAERSSMHMVLRACSLDEALLCMSLTSAERINDQILPDLEALFGLTPSEALIVRDLYQGHTPHRIAEDHQNSIHTIRAHIRRCYDKLDVTCREELWSKLNVYRM